MRIQNLKVIGIEESEDFQLKEPVNDFNKIIKENFPNQKKEIHMNIQELQIDLTRKEIPPVS